jgi:peptide/nickel transport system substrate-binding protein
MKYHVFRVRFRRRFRKGQRQVEDLGTQAEEQLEQNFFGRLERLRPVQRFIAGWLLLGALLGALVIWELYSLGGYYQTVRPVAGGIYSEGILGDFTTANPLFASTRVDSAISRLIFAGLLTYDNNNQLVGDLAQSWSVDSTGTTYTVTLKPGLTWQDGTPLTAADVAFTYQIVQNPDARSPLAAGWQGITVTARGSQVVTFTLPNPLAAFPTELTNGIVPKHLLQNVAMSNMRSTSFNTLNPVGAGPFTWKTLQVSGDTPALKQEQIALVPFAGYNRGAPKLASFIVHGYHTQDQLMKAYTSQEINAVAGLSSMPTAWRNDQKTVRNNFILTAANMVFFKTSNPILNDVAVRQALVKGADTQAIIKSLSYPTKPVVEPILKGQLAYDPTLAQAAYDQQGAIKQLEAAGWVLAPGASTREKAKQKLEFTLYSADDNEDKRVSALLQKQWGAIGVQADVKSVSSDDLQQVVSAHVYDALLQGISIGTDPDVYAYWDSKEASVSLAYRPNFSEYNSATADTALESGRTRLDPALRVIKYRPFLQAWQQDAPALGLYQPRFLYITRQTVYGMDSNRTLNSDTDRYNNVQDWEINRQAVTNN